MRHKITWISAAVLTVAVLGSAAAQTTVRHCSITGGCRPGCRPAPGQPCRKALSEELSSALAAVEAAEKALRAGDKAKALASLAEAKRLVAAARKAVIAPAKPGFANVRCPIMSSPIDPAKVPPTLVRQYKGRKVGFCCAGCPAAWDKLTDADRDVKLAQAAPARPRFVNARCPMMGSPIDPAKVPSSLVRDYKGRKVAFCCAGCPAAWGRLTDAQKEARLKEAGRAKPR